MKKEESWIRLSYDNDEDNIVGNKAGLLALRGAIDRALDAEGCSVEIENLTDTDMNRVVFLEKERFEEEQSSSEKWREIGRDIFFLFLIVILPLFGLYALFELIMDWLIELGLIFQYFTASN